MATFGYIVYLILTLGITLVYLGVMHWPHSYGEKLFMSVLTSVLWFGAWYFFPFTVTIT